MRRDSCGRSGSPTYSVSRLERSGRRSTRREEHFGPLGITGRPFVDPGNSNRVGLIVECPSLEAFHEALQGEGAADAMKFDGVRSETLQLFVVS